MEPVDVSVILPVYNEEDNIALMYEQLKQSLNTLGRPYEIVFVDDGSKDLSFQRLSQLAANDPTVRVIRFRRNYGQTAALSAGIDHSQGEIVILMDADLQNDPADIGRLIAKLDEGYDVVSGWRKNRKDAFLMRKLPSRLANGLISNVTGVHLHDYGCTLKAYRREVLEPMRLYGEMHRFIPVHAYWAGARITELPVNHRARRFGRSKYGISRTFRVLLDLITVKFLGSYRTKPLYAFGYVGFWMALAAFICEAIVVIQRFTPEPTRINRNPLTLLGAVLIVLAVQIVMMGLLAELIMRTYYESQGKTTYVIRSLTIGPATITKPRLIAERQARLHDDDGAEMEWFQQAISGQLPAEPTSLPRFGPQDQAGAQNGSNGATSTGASGSSSGGARVWRETGNATDTE